MMRIWITVTTVMNAALGVVGLGIAGYTVSAKPNLGLLYYGVALVCILCAVVGFLNLPFLHAAARQQEEKSREKERLKARKAAEKPEKSGGLGALVETVQSAFGASGAAAPDELESPDAPSEPRDQESSGEE